MEIHQSEGGVSRFVVQVEGGVLRRNASLQSIQGHFGESNLRQGRKSSTDLWEESWYAQHYDGVLEKNGPKTSLEKVSVADRVRMIEEKARQAGPAASGLGDRLGKIGHTFLPHQYSEIAL